MSYPPGFPKGGRKWTTPKVIVARAYPGPGSGAAGTAADRPQGVVPRHARRGHRGGRSGTYAPARAATIRRWRTSRGSRRTPGSGTTGSSTSRRRAGHGEHAGDRRRLRGGGLVTAWTSSTSPAAGRETDPVNDALIEAVSNVAAAGVVPVIAAGNERDDFGLGSIGSPGSAPDAITVAASSNLHVFAPSLTVAGLERAGDPAERPVPDLLPSALSGLGDARTRRSSTSARSTGTDGLPVDRRSAASRHPNALDTTLPTRLAEGEDRARLARRLRDRRRRRSERPARGRDGHGARRQPRRRGERPSPRHPGRHGGGSRRRKAARLPGRGRRQRGGRGSTSRRRSCTRNAAASSRASPRPARPRSTIC